MPNVNGLPERRFLVRVKYVVTLVHEVSAKTVEEAIANAPEAKIEGDMEIVDILDSYVVRDDDLSHEK